MEIIVVVQLVVILALGTFLVRTKNHLSVTIKESAHWERMYRLTKVQRDSYFDIFLRSTKPAKKTWRSVLGFPENTTPDLKSVKAAYYKLAKIHHPDKGGSELKMSLLNEAVNKALKEVRT